MIREWPNILPVKCEMACFFVVNRDFIRRREPRFSHKIIIREMRKRHLIRCDCTVILVVPSISFDRNQHDCVIATVQS